MAGNEKTVREADRWKAGTNKSAEANTRAEANTGMETNAPTGQGNIGQKLRDARKNSGLTQESAAERLGVSRQTISNWENSRSYPDIGSVVKMSDLYSVSLDKLLKGDETMMRHLEMSTNAVKSRQRFSRMILVLVYLLIWTVTIVSFWWTSGSDAMGYALLAFYLVLPVTTLVISVFIGRDESWSGSRWLMMLFFGVMYMLGPFATFSMANNLAFDHRNLPQLTDMLPGILCSAVGIGIGALIRRRK